MSLSTEPPGSTVSGVGTLVDGLSALARVLVGMTAHTLARLDVDITLPQYRMLVLLVSNGPRRTVDLAADLGVHPSTVTRTSDRLIRRGLVRREHREQDRRVAWVGLTSEGCALVGAVTRQRAGEIRALVESVGVVDPRALASVLQALVAASGELPEAQWWERWARSARHP
ncbi:MarR family winged helix-turn-helix transcriptional regulator [Polymorphospora rubra]|uniref:HTH marR-type domain-containing protein n=1 Tax=Polymorphospora rubra TaxID=338584 RepID=A0A810N6Z4_9ACTN|nr:MarR family transcriptional regulator [Polymorphospora rubra]BCJ69166.1 hypothetical protein Prubr_61870 [Polymorphospora rubra]